jgi:PIN domain nuclease of toxin-antitoxin system
MRLLIDSHVWLWWLAGSERLNDVALEALADGANEVFLSSASVWELAVKHALGRLTLPTALDRLMPQALSDDGIVGLPIEIVHSLRAGTLPLHHRDPFDRMLVAQAQVEGLTLVTADRHLANYEVTILAAD